MKRLITVFMSALLLVQSMGTVAFGATQQEIVSAITFDNMATNNVPEKEVTLTSTNAVYVAETEEGVNKALKFVLKGTTNAVVFSTPTLDGEVTYSFDLMMDEGITGSISVMQGAKTAVKVLTISAEGTITDAEERNVLCSISDGKFTNITIKADAKTKRMSVLSDGKVVMEKRYISTLPSILSGVKVEVKESNLVKKTAYVDNFVCVNGAVNHIDIPEVKYNTEAYDKVDEPSDVEKEIVISDKIVQNNRFDSPQSLQGFNLGTGGGAFVGQYTDERNGNGYFKFRPNGIPNQSRADVNDKGVEYMCFEADFRLVEEGFVGKLFSFRNSRYYYSLDLTADGTVKTNVGKSTVCKLSKSKWTTISLVVDFTTMKYDVYVNKSLVKAGVSMTHTVKEVYNHLRLIDCNPGSVGELHMDNLKVYHGKELRELPKEGMIKAETSRVVGKTTGMELIENKAVGLSLKGGNIFANGEKKKLIDKPYIKDDYTLLPVRAVSEAFGLEVGWNADKKEVTVGNSVLTIGSKTAKINGKDVEMPIAPEISGGSTFLPLRFLSENILGKIVMYDDRGFCLISDEELEFEDSDLWKIQDFLLYDRPEPEEILETFNKTAKGVHPRIVINSDDIAKMKRNYESKPHYKAWVDKLIKAADKLLYAAPTEFELKSSGTIVGSSATADDVIDLSLAYLFTGEKKYVQRCWNQLERLCNWPHWGAEEELLTTGHIAAGVAIAYDWLYNEWTDNQKKLLEESMLKLGIMEGFRPYYYGVNLGTGPSGVIMSTNWNVPCNAGAGMIALALMEVYPEVCSDIVSKSLRGIENMNRKYYPSGAWFEGTTYWQLLSEYLGLYDETLENCLGNDYGITLAPMEAESADYIIGVDGPTGNNNFHDSSSTGGHTIYPTLLWFAEEYGKDYLYGERLMAIEKYGMNTNRYDILWWPEVEEFSESNVGKDLYFPEVELVSMRSAFQDPEAVYLSYHAGAVNQNHGHIDKGAFVLDMAGERWAIDFGTDKYALPGYFSTTRYNIYRLRGEGHNIPIINPDSSPGQDMDAVLPVESLVSGESNAYSVTNLTGAYKDYCTSVRRGFLLGENRRTVTIRDEYSFREKSELYWFMHTKAKVDIVDNKTVILTQKGKSIKLQLITNIEDAKFEALEAQPLPTSPVVEGQAKNSDTTRLAVHSHNAEGQAYIQVRFSNCDDYLSELEPIDMPIDTWEPDYSPIEYMPYLESISVNGKPIEDFDEKQTSYTVPVSFRRTSMPEIAATCGDDCYVEIEQNDDVTKNTIIKVRKKDNPINARSYILSYKEGLADGDTTYKLVKATASSSSTDTNTPKEATDGDTVSYWAADGDGQWLQLEFEEVVPIELIRIVAHQGNVRTADFELMISNDGETWEKLLSYTTDGVTADYQYIKTSANAKFLRLVGHGNSANSWNSYAEFDVVDTRDWDRAVLDRIK